MKKLPVRSDVQFKIGRLPVRAQENFDYVPVQKGGLIKAGHRIKNIIVLQARFHFEAGAVCAQFDAGGPEVRLRFVAPALNQIHFDPARLGQDEKRAALAVVVRWHDTLERSEGTGLRPRNFRPLRENDLGPTRRLWEHARMATFRSRGSPLFLILFALPFAGVGLLMGGLALRTLYRAQEMERWMEVPVTVLEAALEESRGDDSTTYRVTARYTYEVDGRTYESARVGLQGGHDNLGNWQQDRYREVMAARAGQRVLTCRVNPAQPGEAILFPKARTGLVLFYLLFALTFGGAGIGIMAAALHTARQRRAAAAAPVDEPWRARRDWAEGLIKSTNRAEAWGLTVMAVIWNVIAWTIAGLSGRDMLRQGGAAYLFLLFPLVGVVLAVVAVRFQWVARRYGDAVLQMSPVPGVLGGRLAGLIRLPEAARPPDGFVVTVQCQRTTRSGKNSHTTVLWKEERRMEPDALPLVDVGQAIPVLFALPYALPASDEWDGGGSITWKLEVKGKQPGLDVAVSFVIPVFLTRDSKPEFVLDEKPIAAFEVQPGRDAGTSS